MVQPLYFVFAVAQSTAAVLSATLLLANRARNPTGKIKLPIFTEPSIERSYSADGGDGGEELEGGDKIDPFDVSIPLDFLDGTPIDEDRFWEKMHVRKVLQASLVLVLVILDAVSLGWLFIADSSDASTLHIVSCALQLSFSFYILLLSLHTIGEVEVSSHWTSVVHIWGLLALATALFATRLLLPKSITAALDTQILDYVSLGIYLVLFAVASFTNRGPKVHFPPERIYSAKTLASSAPTVHANVTGYVRESIYSVLLFAYTTPVVMLGYTAESLEIRDLPIVPADMRATPIFTAMRRVYKAIKLPKIWQAKAGTGWELLYKLFKVNWPVFMLQMSLASVTAVLYYVPAYFLQALVKYLEVEDAGGKPDKSWGWVYCAGLFFSISINYILTGQLWSLSTTMLQVRLRVQLNTMLFAKTLVRKDIASAAAPTTATSSPNPSTPNSTTPSTPATSSPAVHTAPLPEQGDNIHIEEPLPSAEKNEEEDFSTKAQIMTLMTTDVDRVSEFAWHIFSLVDAPIEIVIGTLFLYRLLGVSAFFGLAVTCLFLPVNHFASKVVIKAQDNLMKSRDERVSLMNEILGGIRMLKFMAWERSFEKRVLAIRDKELSYQRRNYYIEVLFNFIWEGSPILVTLVSFWHFAVVRKMPLTPSIAFTSLSVFNELKFALNTLPETFINMLQSLVSVRRIENYLHLQEVTPVPPLHEQADLNIALNNATIAWPQSGKMSSSAAPSVAPTPKRKFVLIDLSLEFPKGELSLICGKLGSGKTLLLLSLLGEADLLSGQMICPRSPPDVLAKFAALKSIPAKDWVVPGVCAYVPQTAWLQNASIRENILFNLPYDEERYQQTLEACALISDFKILEDGDASEIGERGVNLSGGQKARVSLARAIYSRASVLFLDDVLSAVDAETAHHIFENALKGPLVKGRTIILVSHHVQLCVPGAAYIVALNNGRLTYAGDANGFRSSGVMQSLAQSTDPETKKSEDVASSPVKETIETTLDEPADSEGSSDSELSSTAAATSTTVADSQTLQQPQKQKKPKKLVEEEARAVGRIKKDVWAAYISASGGKLFWTATIVVLLVAAATPVVSNGWLRYWSSVTEHEKHDPASKGKGPLFYLTVYATLSYAGLVIEIARWILRYEGSIRASTVLHKRLLKAVLFAKIRFHDTTNRGRLLNRFGKDFETIDSSLADNFGKTTGYGLSAATTIVTITYVGGWKFFLAALVLGVMYFEIGKVYGQTSRDMRRLDSVTRSPLYTIYGESIAGVAVLRAFGAGSKFLREMHQHVDTNTNPYYWMWGVNRWLSIRFNLLSAGVIGLTAIVVITDKRIDASLAGFALAFASTITSDLLFMVRRFVGLEQSMIALERVKEFSELPQEPAEYIEPRPAASWPHEGAIDVENLVIRYAPDLPNVLHGLNFSITPRSKIGVLGRTGGGKSTLALSFFRFVEATEGRIVIDGIDISKIGLTDLRSRLTIIPQDPTILSGTLRSTLDVFGEYEDHEIYEALRRVHLIPPEGTPDDEPSTVNANTFRNLDSPVAEGGENFSAGEKQLICMARAILKRSKVLFMDEATASVDYATDELIGKTIRAEFADSTILTIAHRLRTVIDYDKIILLDQGRLVEFDRPSTLLADPNSKFYALCKSTGKTEFAVLQRMANEAAEKAAGSPAV